MAYRQDFVYPRVPGDYYVQAITQIYPTLRNGVDFAVAREFPGGDYTIVDNTLDQYMDTAKIDTVATQLITQDPYSGYSPPPEVPLEGEGNGITQ